LNIPDDRPATVTLALEVFCAGDKDRAADILTWAASPLRTPPARAQKALVLLGPPAAGKTLFAQALAAAYGSPYTSRHFHEFGRTPGDVIPERGLLVLDDFRGLFTPRQAATLEVLVEDESYERHGKNQDPEIRLPPDSILILGQGRPRGRRPKAAVPMQDMVDRGVLSVLQMPYRVRITERLDSLYARLLFDAVAAEIQRPQNLQAYLHAEPWKDA
jgi:hypothetical protein